MTKKRSVSDLLGEIEELKYVCNDLAEERANLKDQVERLEDKIQSKEQLRIQLAGQIACGFISVPHVYGGPTVDSSSGSDEIKRHADFFIRMADAIIAAAEGEK